MKLLFVLLILSFNSWANDTAPEQKISKTGAVFILNQSHPHLGNAYQDPSGVVWGDIVVAKNRAVQTTYAEASAYCESIGARLPTNAEYRKLGKYLGAGTWKGYSTMTQDRQEEMLVNLDHYWFWTSTPYWLNPKVFQYIYWGDSGVTAEGQKKSAGGATRCVVSL